MNRNWIKFVILALVVSVAATGCKKKPKPGSDLPPLDVTSIDKGATGISELPTPDLSKPGTNLSKEGGMGVVHFDYDSAVVTHDQEALSKVAQYMKQNSSANVTVTGHCDERGSTEYNLSLGERRALSVRAYLIGLGVDGNRLSTQSFGEEQPAQQGHDESSWRENRRAEFIAR